MPFPLLWAIIPVINTHGFIGEILGWASIATVVVLPASIVSGVQFPLLIASLGQAKENVGKQLGYTYVANTCGSILGSLAGGFGLLPLLSAPGAWRLAVAVLAALSVCLALAPSSRRFSLQRLLPLLSVNLIAILLICSIGPTGFWRHSSIGAGRSGIPQDFTPNNMHQWENDLRREIIWQADGVEAGVTIITRDGLAFFVNGKSDGNAVIDAETQIALGILPAILHRAPKNCLVVGLGTGETAGWLAQVNSVERVDVAEIEPAVKEMAIRCAAVNRDVLANPKVRVIYNDAREMLVTTNAKYDIISSEPSNPYRAGVANLFTQEFYRSADARLNHEGLFVQWLQGYEIDDIMVATVLTTLKSVFNYVEVWQSGSMDMLLVCSRHPIDYDSANILERIGQEPYKSAFAAGWRTERIEGFLARYVGGNALSGALARDSSQFLNTDDHNRLEYGFARTLGLRTGFSIAQLREKAVSLSAHRPNISNTQIDWEGVEDERMAMLALMDRDVQIAADASSGRKARASALLHYLDGDYAGMIRQWQAQSRQATCPTESAMLCLAYAELGNEKAGELIGRLRSFDECEADLLLGILLLRQGRHSEASQTLSRAFVSLRTNPWPISDVIEHALVAAAEIAAKDKSQAQSLLQSLEQPFAVMYMEDNRKLTGCLIAMQIGTKAAIPWIESFEPHVPWTESFLQLRAKAYTATNHPLEARARSDLQLFQGQASAD